MPHLLLHGAPVYYGHLRGPVTLTPIADRLATCFYDLSLSRIVIVLRDHDTDFLHHC